MKYAELRAKTLALQGSEELADGESPFSTNRVTGWSINFPIAATCRPTSVCVKTCYFGCGPATWPASLKKQWRVYHSTVADPQSMAARVARWAGRLRLDYVRWNGGGDLFAESVACINAAAPLMPGVPQWVVTRLPELATSIAPAANVFVHVSVDRCSMHKLDRMAGYAGRWFWSYQCDRGESPPPSVAPVVFYDGYAPPDGERLDEDACPLNAAEDIAGVCGQCRRCFDGAAVSRAAELMPGGQHWNVRRCGGRLSAEAPVVRRSLPMHPPEKSP